jgi:hypothetical protein
VAETGLKSLTQGPNWAQTPRNWSQWTKLPRFRDREAPGSNPGPPTNFEIKIADFARRRKSVGRREVTAVSQIFLEVGRGTPRSSGLRPSVELAYGYRTADISARARP